MDIIFVQELI